MKNYYTLTLVFLFALNLLSCSVNDDGTEMNTKEFAMTAKMNGKTFEANNPFGNNEFSMTNIWSYYPIEDFVMLQARQGGVIGNREINIWLKRSDIAVGTYSIGAETFNTPPSHFIRMFDLLNDISEYTKEGTLVITEVNSSEKMVKGTFEFTTTETPADPNATVDFTVTDGTFNYIYE